jgi:hypothetical protein
VLAPALTLAFLATAGPAFAGVWQWGCVGAMGADQIAFNRDRLIVIAGKAPGGTLDDFVRGGDFAGGTKPASIIATYLPDDGNGGLSTPMTFTSDSGKGKLTLTEESSEDTGHKEGVVLGCRDETFDRFRKTYRVEGDKTPATTVKLMCLDYQLSSRGGRTCE